MNWDLGADGIEGYDKANNAAARMAAAASAALYDTSPMIDPDRGAATAAGRT